MNNEKNIIKEVFQKNIIGIKKLRKEFSYLNLDEKDFIKICLSEIQKSYDLINKPNYSNILTKRIKVSLINILKECFRDSDSSYKTLNNYINAKFTNTNDIKIIVNNFEQLYRFMMGYFYNYDTDIIYKLIKNNTILYNNIDFVYKKYSNFIKENSNIKLFNNSLLNLFIITYCNINNISIKSNDNINYHEEKAFSLKQLPKYAILSKQEERELFDKMKNGDEEAKRILIEKNLNLVVYIAKKRSFSQLELDDLIEEGNIGLIQAVTKYDASMGYRFSTYAVHWINQAMNRAIMEKGKNIRIPCYIEEKKWAYNRAYNTLYNKLRREPTKEEIANYMNISLELVNKIQNTKFETISLDQSITEDQSITLKDVIPIDDDKNPLDNALDNSLKEQISSLLSISDLTDREKYILKMRFGFNEDNKIYTLEELKQVLHLTRERIRQIESKALRKVKIYARRLQLEDYLDDPDAYKKR